MKFTKKMFVASILMMIMLSMNVLAANAATPTSSRYDGEIVGCTVRTAYTVNWYMTETSKEVSGVLNPDCQLIVLEEANGRFKVQLTAEQSGWISTTGVLINVKEYIPSVEVKLPMATGSIFRMADEDIPGLTGEVFYNRTGSADGSEAWLRYEPAKKLLVAQKLFAEQGYGIVIYDAYRPYSATKQFQAAYRSYLNGKSASFKAQWFGQLGESWFLAQKASAHNYGVAVDITLKSLETGTELAMPAPMHNLDYRSAYYVWNNVQEEACANARNLKSTMEKAGFSYLKSEWWHFQDNSIPRNSGEWINIPN